MMRAEVTMSAVKAEAARILDQMPEDTDWDALAYRFSLRAAIERGLADIDAGRVIPHDQVMRETEEWLASLGQRMPEGDSIGT
jgi:predicted transcriptional regulator